MRPAIIWMDGRASKEAMDIMNKFGGKVLFSKFAGAELSGKDALAKLLWLKENEKDIYQRMKCFLDVNGYLTYKATGMEVCEHSIASTIAFDLKKNDWMNGIIKHIGLDQRKFPELVRSIDLVGGLKKKAAEKCGLIEGMPVFGGCGDMQSAAIGSGALLEGQGHICLGTSGWVGVTTSKTPIGRNGVVTLRSGDPDKNLLLGEMETAGVCLNWIKDEFYRGEQKEPCGSEIYKIMDESIREIAPGSEYLIFTPWFYGERCPVSDAYVRSTFFNMSASHKREHMLRAIYEGISFNLRWIIEIIESKFNYSIPSLRVIGGCSNSDEWMQIISDITQCQIEKVKQPQMCGTFGGFSIAAVGLKIYSNFESISEKIVVEKTYIPNISNEEIYKKLYRIYKLLYYSLYKLYRDINSSREQLKPETVPSF